MAPTLSADDVRRVAALAHLELSDADVDAFTPQLARILAYAGEIAAVDTTGIEPIDTLHAAGVPWREDLPAPTLDRDAVMAIAPDANREAGLFRVPKVL